MIPLSRLRTAGRVAVGLGVVGFALWSPPLREGLVALEPAVAPVVFLGALLAWLLSLFARPARRRAREARAGAWLERWGWGLAILAFVLPVWAHWMLRPPGSAAAFAALLGRVPYGDAQQHYEGACSLLAEGSFGRYSERRPLNAALLAVRLAMGQGDLRVALTLHAALCGLCAWLLARAIGLRFGVPAALGTFALALSLSRDFLPTVDTEPLGAALGALGIGILLLPGAGSRLSWTAAGLFAIDAALRARPGAQLVLPALLAWALWVHRARWRRALPAFAGVILVGSLSTSALDALYGAGEASFTTYPAYTLYGLTRSSNWTQARADYGETLKQLGNEKQVAGFLYARAFENLRREPERFFRALLTNFERFRSKLPGNLSRGISPAALFHTALDPPDEARGERTTRLGWPLLVAGYLGLLWFLLRAPAPDRVFWLASLAGMLASVPFVYGDAGFRSLAAVYPLLAAALGAGLGRKRLAPPRRAERAVATLAGALAVGLVVVALAGPGLARALTAGSVPIPPVVTDRLVLRPSDAVAVVVTQDVRAPLDRVPRISRPDFLRMLDWARLGPAEHEHLTSQSGRFALLAAYDYATGRVALLLAPPAMLRAADFVGVETQAVPGSRFLDVVSWAPVSRDPLPR